MKTKTKAAPRKSPTVFGANAADLLERWRRTKLPIVVKVDGSHEFEVGDEQSIQLLVQLVERLENIAAIQEGIDDVDNGRTVAFEEFQAKARAKYGLPT